MALNFGLIKYVPTSTEELMNNASYVVKGTTQTTFNTFTIHTVTTNKTLFLSSIHLSGYASSGTASAKVQIGSNVFLSLYVSSNTSAPIYPDSNSNNVSFNPPLRISSGTVISLVTTDISSTPTISFTASVGGYEL